MDEKLKILLCEDDENLGMLLREYLQAKGFSTELCADGEQLLLGIEGEATDAVHGALLVLLAAYTTEDGLNTEHELLHREGLGDVVVGTELEALENVFLQRLGGQEDDGNLGIGLTNFLSQRETILLGHHYIEHADVELGLQEGLETGLTISTQLCLIALSGQILTQQHTEVLIVLSKQDFQFVVHNCSFLGLL